MKQNLVDFLSDMIDSHEKLADSHEEAKVLAENFREALREVGQMHGMIDRYTEIVQEMSLCIQMHVPERDWPPCLKQAAARRGTRGEA